MSPGPLHPFFGFYFLQQLIPNFRDSCGPQGLVELSLPCSQLRAVGRNEKRGQAGTQCTPLKVLFLLINKPYFLEQFCVRSKIEPKVQRASTSPRATFWEVMSLMPPRSSCMLSLVRLRGENVVKLGREAKSSFAALDEVGSWPREIGRLSRRKVEIYHQPI